MSLAAGLYRGSYVALAAALVLATATATPDAAALSLDRFFGAAIVNGGSIPLRLGPETYTAPGSYSGALGWLGALCAYLLSIGGDAPARLAGILAALATFALVEARARRSAGRAFALAAAAVAAACAVGAFGVGGGVLTATFAAALAFLLERPGPFGTAAATILTILWCNVAPEGLLAPAIAVCFAALRRVDARDLAAVAERRSARIACATTTLAMLVTPAFFWYPALAFEGLRVDRALAGVVPFHPADVAALAYRTGFFLAILVALAFGIQRKRAGAIPLFVFAVILAFANGAYVAVFGVLVAPLLADSAAELFPKFAALPLGSRRGDMIVAVGMAAFAALLVLRAETGVANVPPGYAIAATLADDGESHRLYCANVDWCNAALRVAPRTRVFMDGRVAAYPVGLWNIQRDIGAAHAGWSDVLDAYRVDAVIARRNSALATLVALSGGWRAVRSDESSVLFERPGLPP